MHDLWTDAKVAVRRLRRSPGFVVTAVVSLTLAIAANLVVFGAWNAFVKREMGIRDPHQVLMVVHKQPKYFSQSYPDYLDFKLRNSVFNDLLAYRLADIGIRTEGAAQSTFAYEVTSNYFDALGIKPQLGRFFHDSDEHGINSMPYVILADSFWRSKFAADPQIIGKRVELNKYPYTVIGVAPASFHGTELFVWPTFWVSMANSPQIDGYSYLDKRFHHSLFVLGRLKAGVNQQQALENMNAIASALSKQYPQTDDQMGVRFIRPGMMGEGIGEAGQQFLAGLMVLALLTMIAACTNLASIFAARVADRRRELAVRMAIGSSRVRILRQVLSEAFLLAFAGATAGTWFATQLLKWLSAWQPIQEFPVRLVVAADARVYGIALLLALVGGLLPALLTARQIWTTNAMQAMKEGGEHTILRRLTLRDGLLALQVALCALLVTCGLIGLRGLSRSLHAPIGFQPQQAIIAQISAKAAGYSDDSSLPLEKKMMEEAARIPGVTAVGAVDEIPLHAGGSSSPVFRQGTTDLRASNSVFMSSFYIASPGYLQAAGTRLLTGRDFSWSDDKQHPNVALVNQTFARMLFGEKPAIGQHFVFPGNTSYEVVGVVEDGKYGSLTEDPRPAAFLNLVQNTGNTMTLVVRSERPSLEIATELNSILTHIEPSLPVTIESWSDAMALALFPARVATIALGVLGFLAAVLATTGIFGMASYTVVQRLHELGIRVALGAQRKQVLWAALKRTVLLLTGGSLAGLALGAATSRLLAFIVYQATVYDPVVLIGAVAMMILLGALAAAAPAYRAVQADPAALLRQE